MSAFDDYSIAIQNQFTAICSTQRGAIEQAAAWLGEALANDRGLYAFGTGHSHMMAEEIFYRAGGLAYAVPLLAGVADLAIDNCGVSGDACVSLPGLPSRVGPTSTITGALIVNLIIVQGIESALARGVTPEIYVSSNCGGDAHNNLLLEKYRSRIRHL